MKPRPLLTTGITGLLQLLLLTPPVQSQEANKVEEQLAKLEARLRSDEERVRWQGIHACVQMGESAVPMLTRMFEEKPRQGIVWRAPVAAKALSRLGPKAVECLPAAVKVLKDGNQAQQKMAMEVLGAVGPYETDESQGYMNAVYAAWQGQGRGRAVIRRGRRSSRIQTQFVVECMLRLTEDPRMGVDTLIEHLEGQSAAHREMAIDWLASRGKEAKAAIPALREVARADKQPTTTNFRFRGDRWSWTGGASFSNKDQIRGKAAVLLMKLGAAKDIPPAAYLPLLKHEDPAVRQRAVLELGAMGEKVDSKSISALAQAVSDRDKLVAWDAITALGMIGARAKAAVPRLKGIARGQDKPRAARAEAALRQIQKDENQNH